MDLSSYMRFVETVTSVQSNEMDAFVASLKTSQRESGVNMPLLLTAAIGMAAEGGEFAELPKKVAFQGKPLNEDTVFHMKRELGDIMWYWVNACRALNLDPQDVVAENVRKLEARYPGGEFDSWFSENRKDGDL
jgi:NTP pyrophosphatase (non-canonical NTP hydrolase)